MKAKVQDSFIYLTFYLIEIKLTGGLDELVENLKATAIKFGIPYIFSVKRRRIGYLLFKKVSVGCVGILDYDGSEENVKKLKEIVNEERENYKKKCI